MNRDQKTPIISGLVIGLIIGVIAVVLWNKPSMTATPAQTASNATTTPASEDTSAFASSTMVEADAPGAVQGNGPGIVVDDQNPGKLVIISQVALLKPGWVVIRDSANGKPGTILGVRLFNKGRNSGIVQLSQAMQIGKKYYAELHNDDGNYKTFDPAKDVALKDASGSIIMTSFSVTQASDKQ